jgi:enoyl-CoA hydratase
MSDELVHLTQERGVATITLDSPANRNALSGALVTQLVDRLAATGRDPGIRAVVLTHTGTVFCAGVDLREQTAGGPPVGSQRIVQVMRAIVELPKPVLARVDGAVRAGGIGILGACDLVVCSSRASFAFSEVRLGLAPVVVSLTTSGRMTERAASRYYLTGETFGGDTAMHCGLVTESVNDLDAAVTELLDGLRQGSPQGLAETKRLTTERLRAALGANADEMIAWSARLFGSAEAQAGMRAVLAKRRPPWIDD